MSNEIFVIGEHLQKQVTDGTYEALAMARRLATATGGHVVAGLAGSGIAPLAADLAADTVVVYDDPALDEFTPDGHTAAFATLISQREPRVVLVPYTSMGMDLAAAVAARTGLPLVSYCRDVRVDGGLAATCQLYAGKIEADVAVDGERAIFAMLAGAASADEGRGAAGSVETVGGLVDLSDPAVAFLELTEPGAADVDITAHDVLVVVGRGIDGEDNIELAQELADALGGAVAASRPIVDQGWLPKTRQVGKSGLTVKPKVYLALGVSGAPEHIEGMRDAGTIVAVNTDPQAPIFGVAHYGWVGDLFDILPELTDLLEG